MLILGSGSEARRTLLTSAGIIPEQILVPDIDESSMHKELPSKYVKRMATEKSNSLIVAADDVLITADTIVVVGKSVLHKTDERIEAKRYLSLLSGRTHFVLTAFNIRHQNKNHMGLEKTFLRMKYLTFRSQRG